MGWGGGLGEGLRLWRTVRNSNPAESSGIKHTYFGSDCPNRLPTTIHTSMLVARPILTVLEWRYKV